MVNALFSSKPGGTKQFKRVNEAEFGWKAITDLYTRELIRVSKSQARMVPRLREAHCLRDSWTKLNVLPAKIMQVSNNTHICAGTLHYSLVRAWNIVLLFIFLLLRFVH